MDLTRDVSLVERGSAQRTAPAVWRLIDINVAEPGVPFSYRLNREKLKKMRQREGRYLLRVNLTETDSMQLWNY